MGKTAFSICLSTISVSLCLTTTPGAKALEDPVGTKATVTQPVPTTKLEYDKPEKTSIRDASAGFSVPLVCSEDGSLFFMATSIPGSPDTGPPKIEDITFALYSIQSATNAVRYDPYQATSLKRITPRGSFAVSESKVVILVDAVTADELLNDKNKANHPFLLVYDRKGQLKRTSPLDLSIEPVKIGILESGEILVTGSAPGNSHQEWTVVDDDGSHQRNFIPDQKDQTSGERLQQLRQNILTGYPEMIPYHQHLLFLEMNTDRPIMEVNARGIYKVTQLKLPPGEMVEQVIPSSGRIWHVLLGHTDTKGDASIGMPAGLTTADAIGEFDPESGEMLRKLETDKDHNLFSLGCEVDGVFHGLDTDPNDGSLMLDKASIGK